MSLTTTRPRLYGAWCWPSSGIELGTSEREFSALPTELSDISPIKFSISYYIGDLAPDTTTANFTQIKNDKIQPVVLNVAVTIPATSE